MLFEAAILNKTAAKFIFIILLDSSRKKRRPNIAQKLIFPLRISSKNIANSQFLADLVTFTEKNLNGKLHFLCSVISLILS